MSISRIIYNKLKGPKISISPLDFFNPNSNIRIFLSELTGGNYIDALEKHEIEKFQLLAQYIDNHTELLSKVSDLIGKQEAKDTLLEHRRLIHSLFFNKKHILNQIALMIDELENQVKLQEYRTQTGYKVVHGKKK